MNTYLVYCRFQKMRGGFTEEEYERELSFVGETLAAIDEPHWREYLGAWRGGATASTVSVEATVAPEPAAPAAESTSPIYIDASSIRT
jgi:hypothetical protein